jgi:hypothetical protein
VSRWYRRLDDGTTWPDPDGLIGDADHLSLEWLLRYAGLEPLPAEVRLTAASTVAAYVQLVTMPRRRREQIIAALRRPGTPTGSET